MATAVESKDAVEPKDAKKKGAEEKTEPDRRSVHERMVAILAELPAIGKDAQNTQQNFMYRSHDQVMNALNPLLAKHGVFLVPEVLERATAIRTTGRGTTMYEVNLHVRYTFYGASGDSVSASAWGEGTDMGDKSTNKAMTMALKNVVAQTFAISTEEFQYADADGGSPEETRAGTAVQATPAPPLADRLRRRVAELCQALDAQTQAEPGTWARLVADAVAGGWGDPYESAEPDALEDVGKHLRAQIDAGVTEAPEQIDLRP